MKHTSNFLAIDLGASNGRIFTGSWNGKSFALTELHRFVNSPIDLDGHLHWDVRRLWLQIKDGLRCAHAVLPTFSGIGVDGWGVDFALLGSKGSLLGDPYCYRDQRTMGVSATVFSLIPEPELFTVTGVQSWQINTLFQIFSMVRNQDSQLAKAISMLMIPDLFTFWLCGEKNVEYTVGSTSEMLRVERPEWAYDLLDRLEIPSSFLPPVVATGTALAPMHHELALEMNLSTAPPVFAVAAHDTASTVAAISGMDRESAFISIGTWSLMGVEISKPITNKQVLHAGFSNERGAADSVLLIKNMAGLWLLQECMRQWKLRGISYTWSEVLKLTEESEPFRSFIDTDAPEFLAPANMLLAIRNFCEHTGQPIPQSPGSIFRCCLESLSLRYREVLSSLQELTGRRLSAIRIAGGGCLNQLLCQYIANATKETVIAGPVEASVWGNVIIQAIATGHLKNLAEGREVIASSIERSIFEPNAIEVFDEAFHSFQRVSSSYRIWASADSNK